MANVPIIQIVIVVKITIVVVIRSATRGRALRFIALAPSFVFKARHFAFVALFIACASRDVSVFTLNPPRATGASTVIELDHVTQGIEFKLRQFTRITDAQAVKRQTCKRHALQLLHFIAKRFKHTVNLPLFTLVNRQRDPRVPRLGWQLSNFCRQGHAVIIEAYAGTQPL